MVGMRLFAGILIVLAACADAPEPVWEPLEGLPNERIFQLRLDPTGRPLISTSFQIWRYSDSRRDWGQVGLEGRNANFVPGPFAVDTNGVVYAAETDVAELIMMYRLPVGGGHWEPFDAGLTREATAYRMIADRDGAVYAATRVGMYRLPPGGSAWEKLDEQDWTECADDLGWDNTLYLSCAGGAFALPPGGNELVPLESVLHVHSVNRDNSINVTMVDRSNGRLAAGATTPTPYPALPLLQGYEDYLPTTDSLEADVPVPFAVDADDNVYAIGEHSTYSLVDVFKMERGGSAWTPLRADANSLVREFLVTPEGDIFHWSQYVAITQLEAAYRLRAQ